MFAACGDTDKQLRERAEVLCRYIPDHELLAESKDYLTSDFYALLDTMFNLPEHEAMDHEWLYYFVTGNGGSMADCEVVEVVKSDRTHAVATINVRQKWEDGSFADPDDIEEHKLYMEKVDGEWLMSDFDGHKADCRRHIDINRQEQKVRQAIGNYLSDTIGPLYLKGDLCIPTLMIAAEESDATHTRVYGDFWVMWYNIAGDTLKTISGGNHPGCIALLDEGGKLTVSSFEQVEDGAGNDASAKRIFGKHYDIFQNMHSNQKVREAARHEQIAEYIHRNDIEIHYIQDFGWDAVEL